MKQTFGTDAVSEAIEKHSDMVRRICFLYLKNKSDVEDVFQEVFLRFFQNAGTFENGEHEKAWLCRVTFNKCKDLCRSYWRKHMVSIEEIEIPYENPEQGKAVSAVLELSPEYRELIYLHYYEGRPMPEVAEIMNKNINTAYSMLRRAKSQLKRKVGETDGRL